ncbi:MAG: cobalamin-dependent protein [Spirochaetes bacterium]|nr:cobalamin-dependent protein [Spirochaetota bacterium]
MKIVLGYCVEKEHRNDYYLTLLPVGLVSIASYLSHKGFDVTLANFSKESLENIVKKIKEIKPQIIGFSLYTHNRHITFAIINKIKKILPKTVIVLGGPHATFLAKEIIAHYPAVDYVVEGEGEEAMLLLARSIKAHKPINNRIIHWHKSVNLHTLPYPAKFGGNCIGVNPNEQYKYIITSRGCSFNCTFCDSPSFWGRKVRFRDIDDVIDELEVLYKKYGIIYFSIRDDNFTLKKDRVYELSHKMIKKKLYMMWNCQARVDAVDEAMLIAMKKAGLEHIQYGVESGSQKILSLYDKKITIEKIIQAATITRNVGVYLSVYLMVGMENETYEDIKKTKKIIHTMLPGDCIVSPVALYPGTRLYEKQKEKGILDDSIWFKKKDAGIFLRNEPFIKEWMNELLMHTYNLREKAWYKAKDFALHRKVVGQSWVTDILEGDYYLDNERYPEASRLYSKVIKTMPDNPWGYMRFGKLHFTIADYETAMESFYEVTRIVPNYYGGWLKYAQSCIALGIKEKAQGAITRAMELNRYDERVRSLHKLLNNKK